MSDLYMTGMPFLDEMIGGGLRPGTLTVVRGATGIGKTQLGLAFCNAGLHEEGHRGIVLDMATRGDSQQHNEYAKRLFDWTMQSTETDLEAFWNGNFTRSDYYNSFGYGGKRVLRDELNEEQWRAWKSTLNERLKKLTAHFYYHFVHGVRRVVVDGIEPFDNARDSIQIELFEYVLHQVLRKQHDWVARDLFMGKWQEVKEKVEQNPYDHARIAGVFMQTTRETELHQLVSAHTVEDDLIANATTVILMGRLPSADRVERGIFVLKNRGGYCSDEIVRFAVTATGLQPL